MGFTNTVKKMLGKDKKKKKSGEKNFYLENESKRPSRDTYDMSGIEDIGEMPPRNPNNSRDETNVPGRSKRGNPDSLPRGRNQNNNFEPNSEQNLPKTNNRSFNKGGGNLPRMPDSEPRKGKLPDLNRGPTENFDRHGDNVNRNDMDRIMDRLDDIENRLRSIERRVRRR